MEKLHCEDCDMVFTSDGDTKCPLCRDIETALSETEVLELREQISRIIVKERQRRSFISRLSSWLTPKRRYEVL